MCKTGFKKWIYQCFRAFVITALTVAPLWAARADSQPEDTRTWTVVSLQQLLLMLPGGGSLGKCTLTIGGDSSEFTLEISAPNPEGGKMLSRKFSLELVEGDFAPGSEDKGAPRAPADDLKFPEPGDTSHKQGVIEMRSGSWFKDKPLVRFFFDRNEQRVVSAQLDDGFHCER